MLRYEIEVKNREGEVIKRISGESKSLLKNFMIGLWAALYSFLTKKGTNIIDRDGVSHTFPYVSSTYPKHMVVTAPANNDDYGILVGTGETEVSPDDTDLASPISHGTGAGQLSYGTTTCEEPTVSDSVVSFRILRSFTNNSGASVTVKEIGIAFLHGHADDGDIYVLMARDVLSSPTTIPDGASLTVRYTLSITV